MKYFSLVAILLVVFAVSVNLSVASESDKEETPLCFCPRMYDPVCASNRVTYANRCQFDCEKKQEKFKNLQILRKGRCEGEDAVFRR